MHISLHMSYVPACNRAVDLLNIMVADLKFNKHQKDKKLHVCHSIKFKKSYIFVPGMQPDNDEDEIAYFSVRWKTRASFVYITKNMR